MRLILNDMKDGIASQDMKDDAFEIWIALTNENAYKAAPGAFYSTLGIKKNQIYTYLEFVDTETGEILFLNVLPKLHNAMVRYELYPQFILNGLKRTV